MQNMPVAGTRVKYYRPGLRHPLAGVVVKAVYGEWYRDNHPDAPRTVHTEDAAVIRLDTPLPKWWTPPAHPGCAEIIVDILDLRRA